MKIDLRQALNEHQSAMDAVHTQEALIQQAISSIKQAFAAGRTIYACGNGGSAADAQHFASELTGRFEKNRPGFPAFALSTDSSALTAIGNDYGFDQVFSRQLQSIGRAGDVLLGISTSGESKNIIAAVTEAKSKGIKTIGLLGRNGGALAKMVDIPIVVPAPRTSRIQESHIFILHYICEAFEP
jgi:D-sedoheptulose 7-phosphate isomerase